MKFFHLFEIIKIGNKYKLIRTALPMLPALVDHYILSYITVVIFNHAFCFLFLLAFTSIIIEYMISSEPSQNFKILKQISNNNCNKLIFFSPKNSSIYKNSSFKDEALLIKKISQANTDSSISQKKQDLWLKSSMDSDSNLLRLMKSKQLQSTIDARTKIIQNIEKYSDHEHSFSNSKRASRSKSKRYKPLHNSFMAASNIDLSIINGDKMNLHKVPIAKRHRSYNWQRESQLLVPSPQIKNEQTLKIELFASQMVDDNKKQLQFDTVGCKSTKDFLLISKGKGRFGQFFLGVHKKTGFICGVKIIQFSKIKHMEDQFIMELKIQSFFNNEHIVQIYGWFCEQNQICILMEYMEQGSVYDYLKKHKSISQPTTAKIIRQIGIGLKDMHANQIIHRDIKPQNIVMTFGKAKICDFGWSAVCKSRRDTYCGTLDYISPEIVEGKSYDLYIDIWCLGVLAYELLMGIPPFYDRCQTKTKKNITECKYQIPESISAQAREFIELTLQKDTTCRSPMFILMQHQFLKNSSDL